MRGLSFCILLLINLLAFGQEKKGDNLFEKKLFTQAVEAYLSEIDRNPTNVAVYQKLGATYAELRDYPKAEEAYKKALESDEIGNEKYINHGFSLIKMGRYDNAKKQFEKYNSLVADSLKTTEYVNLCDSLMTWNTRTHEYSVKSISGINTPAQEFAPTPYQNGLIYAANGKTDWVNYVSDNATRNNYLDIHFAAKENDNWTFNEKDLLSPRLSSNLHDGPATVDTVDQKIYFTRLVRTPKNEVLQIFVSETDGDKIKVPKPFVHNSDEYSVIHPTFNDNHQLLFFASNKLSENKGGYDIYYCQKTNDDSWSEPQPLPGNVNSAGNEVFPYYHNGYLYFASDGHFGYGGLDIFSATSSDDYSNINNLHAPINSHDDDFSISFLNDNQGYFASDRPGGKGSDDIYGFERIEGAGKKKLQTISGVFEFNKLPQAGAAIALYDEDGNEIMRIITDEKGTFSFTNLNPNGSYSVRPIDDTDDSEIYITDEENKKIMLLTKNAAFHFETLSSKIDNEGLPYIDLDDPNMIAKPVTGYVFMKIKGDYGDQVAVVVYDQSGNMVTKAVTDENGVFSFKSLNTDKNYVVKLQESDVELQMEINSLSRRVYDNLVDMSGVFELEKQPMAGEVMALYNEDGVEMFRTITDANGQFKFRSIDPDKKYSIHPINDIDGTDIYMTNEQGHKTHLLTKNSAFRYTTIQAESTEGIASIVVDDPDMINNPIKGHVFRKIKGDFNQELTVMVYDDEGNFITQTTTDQYGQFNFEKLGSLKNYTLKIEGVDADIIMEITGIQKLTEYGFTPLPADEINAIVPIDLVDASLITKPLSGFVFKEIKGDFSGRMEVVAYDDEGNIIARTFTDKNGEFNFQSLPPQNEYFLKVLAEDGDINLGFLDPETNEVTEITADKNGQFTYERLSSMENTIEIINEEGVTMKIRDNELFSTSKIYYEYNSSYLTPSAKSELDKLVVISKLNPHIVFALGAHTDTQGEEDYNLMLSEKRAKSALTYLVEKGVQDTQVTFKGYGETTPIVSANEIEKMSSEEEKEAAHAKNRRTDIKITTNKK